MKLFVCALEPSANLHLKEILKYLKNIELFGIFDTNLGFKPLYDSSEFGIMGVVDAIKIYQKAKKALEECALLAMKCDKALLIDSPAFNIPMAKKLRTIGFDKEINYYILPQIWAWKKNRVKTVEQVCDNLLAILPFEERFWNKAVFVGNPLVDEIKYFKNTPTNNNTIAFLPGSRKSEIKFLMPIFKDIAKELKSKKLLLSISANHKDNIKDIYGDTKEFELSFDVHQTLYQADFAFICSGTATLEASIIGTPFSLVYKAKKLDYFIGRYFVKLPFVGLANLIFWFNNEEVLHPEFLQKDATAKNLINSYKTYNKEKFFNKALKLREILKNKSGASKKVATILNTV